MRNSDKRESGAACLVNWFRKHAPKRNDEGKGNLVLTTEFTTPSNPPSVHSNIWVASRIMGFVGALGFLLLIAWTILPGLWAPPKADMEVQAKQAVGVIQPDNTNKTQYSELALVAVARPTNHGPVQVAPTQDGVSAKPNLGPAECSLVQLKYPSTLTTRSGIAYEHVSVSRVEPDGLTIEYTPRIGGIGLAKLKFRDLPEFWQRHYGYDPGAAAAYEMEQTRGRARSYTQPIAVRPAQSPSSEQTSNIALLRSLASNYHRTHTYSKEDAYVCVDMACDLWNMVKTKGLEARIMVGNVEKDMRSLEEANHAWVLAEVAPGEWLAVEATGGFVVFQNENGRYYIGRIFSSPREFKEFYYGRGSRTRTKP